MSVDAGVVEQFTEWRAAENVDAIGDALFGVRFTPGQALLAGHVAFLRHKRLTATCHTRFGKTFSVAERVRVKSILVAGGVSANQTLRQQFETANNDAPVFGKANINLNPLNRDFQPSG